MQMFPCLLLAIHLFRLSSMVNILKGDNSTQSFARQPFYCTICIHCVSFSFTTLALPVRANLPPCNNRTHVNWPTNISSLNLSPCSWKTCETMRPLTHSDSSFRGEICPRSGCHLHLLHIHCKFCQQRKNSCEKRTGREEERKSESSSVVKGKMILNG